MCTRELAEDFCTFAVEGEVNLRLSSKIFRANFGRLDVLSVKSNFLLYNKVTFPLVKTVGISCVVAHNFAVFWNYRSIDKAALAVKSAVHVVVVICGEAVCCFIVYKTEIEDTTTLDDGIDLICFC